MQINGTQSRARRALIIQTYVPHYRKPFFDGLRSFLGEQGIQLDLLYGDPPPSARAKSDAAEVSWAKYKPNHYVKLGGRFLVYQPGLWLALSSDLVIVEQANKLLLNPILLLLNAFGLVRLAYWGHGKNFQATDGAISRVIKSVLLTRVHWWFAYNELSAAIVKARGFSNERTTSVMNTIEARNLEDDLASIDAEALDQYRRKLGIRGRNTCVFIGGMYKEKRLPFLLECCEAVRSQVEDFEILFLGGGEDRAIVDEFAKRNSWAVAFGPAFDRDKALALKTSKLLLMPGLVGLAIIDGFAAEVPIVTTAFPLHSPEIDYLVDGVNGIMVSSADDTIAFSDAIVQALNDPVKLATLRQGCRASKENYSMERMIWRFGHGILAALQKRSSARS
ncbi:glycosyltransferase family 4 protein [Bradyrhizobium sp. GCM10028915]|uniref:glycosyltransferase family 4 protein n=1 Tax=Bradyrhizobium sp. GCM10028915 TaxID=3273385 RepID=UPI003612D964